MQILAFPPKFDWVDQITNQYQLKRGHRNYDLIRVQSFKDKDVPIPRVTEKIVFNCQYSNGRSWIWNQH